MHIEKQGYRQWFNSPYYHLLYGHHNQREATVFIDKLIQYLQPAPSATMLDVACGKGRHARELAALGYEVTGIDLSEHSILKAKKWENEHLSFYQHDMRLPFWIHYFDDVFNFFTSFGYFDTDRENSNALRSMCHALKTGGILVMDYMNGQYVKEHLVADEVKIIRGVEFVIHREYQEGYFFKNMRISDIVQLRDLEFTERVRDFNRKDFEAMLRYQNMRLLEIFGDYHFNTWDPALSPRLIMVAKRLGSSGLAPV